MPAWSNNLSDAVIHTLVIYIREQRAGPRPTMGSHIRMPQGLQHSELYDFRVESVGEADFDYPWSIAFLPDGRLLVTETNTAQLRAIDHGKLYTHPLTGVMPECLAELPDCKHLFAVAPHPKYSRNGWIYLSSMIQTAPDSYTVILSRGRIHDDRWSDAQKLLEIPGESMTARIAFDAKGYVYLTTGETSLTEQRDITFEAQDLSRGEGKIYRIHDDGRIPKDNPFLKRPGALPAIWTYGHRVPQGLAFNSNTHTLWSTEHGPRGGDELNWIRGGRNYGWPVITYGMEYTGKSISDKTAQEGMEQPITYWTPSIGVSSITFYEGKAFPNWRHNLFVASLRQRTLYRLVLDHQTITHREAVLEDIARIRDITTGPDGYLYLLLNDGDINKATGRIVRLVPGVGKDR